MPKCKICGKKFTAKFSSFEKACSQECAVKVALAAAEKFRKEREKERKKENAQWKANKKEELMSLSEWIRLAQIVFNKYVRLRDRDKPCISSGRPLTGKYDCGHYYSTGAYPNLRFEEDNAHGQTVHDNRDKHGNLIAYREGLIQRIGMERFTALEQKKNTVRKYTISEVKELIQHYRDKIKELQKNIS